MARHGEWVAGAALRLAGAIGLAAAYGAARVLLGLARGGDPTAIPVAYLLALLAFGGASAGAALLVYGSHLFDPVRDAERWARRPTERDGNDPA